MINEKSIRDAYARIRTIDQTIPDDVLDFMKDASINHLKNMKKEDLTFEDAQAMRIKYPDTFEAPTKEDLDNLKIGDFVKVCIQIPNRVGEMPESERFWIEITKIKGDVITGKVSNDLIYLQLSYQETISFVKNNIYSTL